MGWGWFMVGLKWTSMLQFDRRITTWPPDVVIRLPNYNMPPDVVIRLPNYNPASRYCNSIVELQHSVRMLQFDCRITTRPPDVVIWSSNYNMAHHPLLVHAIPSQYTAPNRGRQQCNSDQAKLATTQSELETHMCCPGRESQENKEKTSACPFMKQIRPHLTPFTFIYK